MAWRSGGTTNDEMVNNLKRFGVIHSQAVEDGFRAVDRQYFVPRNRQDIAHSDQPLKEGNVHISAPHIYGSVIEALELPPNSPLSFLNIGSGTGYLSCIVAEILGPTSIHYGIELHSDVLEHSRGAIQAWKAARTSSKQVPPMEMVRGNGLQINGALGECRVGIDRIYIGAAVEKRSLSQLVSLLKPGGILVGPVDDELVKVVRIGNSDAAVADDDHAPPPRSLRGQTPALSGDFSQQVISGVRFAPLLNYPSMPTVLPSRIWSPAVHAYYPESFRSACKHILLCSHASQHQPPPKTHNTGFNVASTLPRALWMEILSYTRQDWFEQPRSDEIFLRRRLREAQAAAQRAQEARMEAETRLHMVERERDIYRLLALRWQRRLQAAISERHENETGNAAGDDDLFAGIDDVAAAAVFAADEPLVLRLGGLGSMIRRFQQDSDNEDEEEDDDNHDQEANNHADMDEETDASVDEEAMQDASDSTDHAPMDVSPSLVSSTMAVRAQVRSVSIGEDI